MLDRNTFQAKKPTQLKELKKDSLNTHGLDIKRLSNNIQITFLTANQTETRHDLTVQ